MSNEVDEEIVLIATDGEKIHLTKNHAGVATGFGYVVNGYSAGVEYFDKYDDGDTVIGCDADHPQAMPVADAYQALRAEYDRESALVWAEAVRQGETTLAKALKKHDSPSYKRILKELLAPWLAATDAAARAPLTDNPFARLLQPRR